MADGTYEVPATPAQPKRLCGLFLTMRLTHPNLGSREYRTHIAGYISEGEVEQRPAAMRIEEAAALPGVDTLVVTCPKDLVMFRDAAKSCGHADRLAVRDLIELVSEAL